MKQMPVWIVSRIPWCGRISVDTLCASGMVQNSPLTQHPEKLIYEITCVWICPIIGAERELPTQRANNVQDGQSFTYSCRRSMETRLFICSEISKPSFHSGTGFKMLNSDQSRSGFRGGSLPHKQVAYPSNNDLFKLAASPTHPTPTPISSSSTCYVAQVNLRRNTWLMLNVELSHFRSQLTNKLYPTEINIYQTF